MNELALFAGAGGGLLGSRLLGWRTVCAVERDPYRQAVLLARQADGCLDSFPIWDDVRTFDGRPWRGLVDVVTAGFPCQPFSVAGKRRGSDDERNGWPDTIRIIREVGPRFALLENVPGLLAHEYARTVFGELAEAGFDAEWTVLGADDVGAPHRRKRLWILAHADRSERGLWIVAQRGPHRRDAELAGACTQGAALPDAEEIRDANGQECSRRTIAHFSSSNNVSDARIAGLEERRELSGGTGAEFAMPAGGCRVTWWHHDPADADPAAQSFVGRVADGVAHRVDRLAALGDGQVPAVVVAAWRELWARIGGGR